MRPVVTDRVALSVGLSVCYTSEPCNTAAQIEMPFGFWARMDRRNHVLDGGPAVLEDVAMATIVGFPIIYIWGRGTLASSGEYE